MQDTEKDKEKADLSWTKPSSIVDAVTAKTSSVQHAEPSVARSVGIFAAGVVVGVLVGWGFSVMKSEPVATSLNASEGGAVARAGLSVGPNGEVQGAFEVSAEQKAGKKVVITRAVVSAPTWIVVYDSVDGTVGRALGASLFSPQKQSGTVTLLRATVPGKSYFVGQAVDNGNGTFSMSTDTPVMVGEERLLLTFTAN
ncbi:hypothetical protein IT396_00810 [Candidatus Nomurabacteria bacterium]|nr:hypothetical protein [Candidatus Nomurabacteria bacterium]